MHTSGNIGKEDGCLGLGTTMKENSDFLSLYLSGKILCSIAQLTDGLIGDFDTPYLLTVNYS